MNLLTAALVLTTSFAAHWPGPVSISGPKIEPGRPSVPTDAMKRPRAFLIDVNSETRIGTFRLVEDGSVVEAVLLPHSELYHHATAGELEDFRPLEHVIVRLHQDHDGEWRLATYIKDDLWQAYGHKQHYRVDKLDAETGRVDYTVIDPKGERFSDFFRTDSETRYWKNARPARFADIRAGDLLRVKTHGTESGPERVAWEVILDDESFEKIFRLPQIAQQTRRLEQAGLPGYITAIKDKTLTIAVNRLALDFGKAALEPGTTVRAVPTGWNQRPIGDAVDAVVESLNPKKRELVIKLQGDAAAFTLNHTARIRVDAETEP